MMEASETSTNFYETNSVAPEPEGLSPYSQEPTTGPYSEPTESSPLPLAYLRKIRSGLIHPSRPRSSEWSLSFWLSYQNLIIYTFQFSPMRATYSAHPILFCFDLLNIIRG
jgi:hypothetical protein